MFKSIARAVVRFRWPIIVGWVIAAVVINRAAPALPTSSVQSSFLPDSYQSVQATNLAKQAFPKSSGATAIFVVERSDGTRLTAADQARVDGIANELAGSHVDRVQSVATGPQAVSPNHMVQIIHVTFAGAAQDAATQAAAKTLRAQAGPLFGGTGLREGLTGQVAFSLDGQTANQNALKVVGLITILLIVVLQLLIFRSPLAALLPIVTVGIVLAVAVGLIGWAARIFSLTGEQFTESILTVVLFGVGTDYVLFLLFRYREHLRAGEAARPALIGAVEHVGEVIASAAAVVIIAFGVLGFSSLGMFKSLGPSLAIAVAVTLVAALTLVPAVVSLLGPRVFWPSKAWRGEPRGILVQRAAALVGGHPALTTGAAALLMVALALGLLRYQASYDPNVSLPGGTESAQAYNDLKDGFPPGVLNPTTVYLQSEDGEALQPVTVQEFASQMRTVRGVQSVLPPERSSDGKVAEVDLVLGSDPSSDAALDQVANAVRPAAVAAAPPATRALVGGQAAVYVDTRDALAHDYRLVFPLAALLIALVLALLLRSLIAPWYLIGAVGLTFASTLGLTVLVSQRLLGNAGLLFELPVIVYMFVVGLGTDYNVLMVSRLREEVGEGHNPRVAAARAVRRAGPSAASAGIILAGTFASLLLGGTGLLTQVGLAVSAGVFIAAFVMSMFLVPGVSGLLGRLAWWPSRRSRRSAGVSVASRPMAPASSVQLGNSSLKSGAERTAAVVKITARSTAAAHAMAEAVAERLEVPLIDLGAGADALAAALRESLRSHADLALGAVATQVARSMGGGPAVNLEGYVLSLAARGGAVILDPSDAVMLGPAESRSGPVTPSAVAVRAGCADHVFGDGGERAQLLLDLAALSVPSCVAIVVAAASVAGPPAASTCPATHSSSGAL